MAQTKEEYLAKKKMYRESHREEIRAYQRIWKMKNKDKPHKAYSEGKREEYLAKKKAYRDSHKEERRTYQKSRNWNKNWKGTGTSYKRMSRRANPERSMLNSARQRAKKDGLNFNLSLEDIVIPSHCPIFGIPLLIADGLPNDNSPSLDKIDPALGYVKGNVQIISHRANRLKSNGAKEEHLLIAEKGYGIRLSV